MFPMRIRRVWVGVLLAAFTTPAAAAPLAPPLHTEVSPGVHLFQTTPYGDAGLDGNSVAVVGDDGVLVFDANGTPAAARAVIEQLRSITRLPVRYLVLSHWHWDHWYGTEEYARAFPGVVIVAHEATRALMAGPAIAFNQPGLDEQLPAHIRDVEMALAAARDTAPRSPAIARWERHLAADRFFLAQKRSVRHTLATLTFTDSLAIRMGRREVRVLHVDRAITPGDAFLYLPRERLVVCGDLLVNPITFALFCYPEGWIRTLRWLDALDATTLVPGHGAVLRDEALLHATIELLEHERTLALRLESNGSDVSRAIDAVLADPDVVRLRAVITGGETSRYDAFALYLVDWFVRRVFAEAHAPLDDTIPGAP